MGDRPPPLRSAPIAPIGRTAVLAAALSYGLVFSLLYWALGSAAALAGLAWVGALGWLYGAQVGFQAGLVGLLLHVAFLAVAGGPPWTSLVALGVFLGPAAGAGLGWLREALERSRQAEDSYRLLLNATPLGIFVHDGERVLVANPEAGRLFGVGERMVGMKLPDLLPADALPAVRGQLEAVRRGAPDPDPLDLTLHSAVVEWKTGPIPGPRPRFQVIVRDLTPSKQLEAVIGSLTYRDPATGLPNRRAMSEVGVGLFGQGEPLGVLWLELADFRGLISALGHAASDEVLRLVADRLGAAVRRGDVLAHFGEGGFAVLAREAARPHLEHLAERLIAVFQAPVPLGSQQIMVRATCGAAVYPADGRDLDTLLSAAAAAQRQAGLEGLPLLFHDPLQARQAREQMGLEGDLHLALQQQNLTLHFQPVLDLQREEIVGVEALARWVHPTRGAISPTVFIPLAEERGLIRLLDRYVLERALQAARQLPGWVAVNLSAQSFLDATLPEFVRQTLARYDVEPSRLVLEITERVLTLPAKAQPVLDDLQNLGVLVSVDDFGTGYSSLGYIREFSLDHLKLPQTFTRHLGKSAKDEALLGGILALAKGLGLTVVAEGVEDAEQLRWLRRAGCDLAQGFHIARPMSLDRLAQHLAPKRHAN